MPEQGKKELTEQQKIFCSEWLSNGFKGKDAAITAGYSPKTAENSASRLLSQVKIQDYLSQLKDEREKRTQINADFVLLQAAKIHKRCMQEREQVYEYVNGKKEAVLTEDGEPVYKFDANGAIKSLETIAKHVNIKAFDMPKETKEIDVNFNVSAKDVAKDILFALAKAQKEK